MLAPKGGGLGGNVPEPLQMVDTRQYARKDVGPKGGGLSGNVLAFSGSIIYLHGINCITIR